MSILVFKTLHVIGFVSWFAALFYLGRLFVYHKEALEANNGDSPILIKQYGLMEWRVYKIIMTPAMIITWVAGIAVLYLYGYEWFKVNLWMHFKILFLLVLSGYHGYCKGVIKKIQQNGMTFSSFGFRLFNEVPTILLLLIASLAVFKNSVSPIVLSLVLVVTIVLLIVFTYYYRNIRNKNDNK